MTFTNSEIYNLASKVEVFYQDKQARFGMPIGFYLFKNLKLIKQAAQEVEEAKQRIVSQYSAQDEEGNYCIPKESRNEAQEQLNQLSKLTQEIPLYLFKLEDFNNEQLTGEELAVLVEMMAAEELKEDE